MKMIMNTATRIQSMFFSHPKMRDCFAIKYAITVASNSHQCDCSVKKGDHWRPRFENWNTVFIYLFVYLFFQIMVSPKIINANPTQPTPACVCFGLSLSRSITPLLTKPIFMSQFLIHLLMVLTTIIHSLVHQITRNNLLRWPT